MGLRPTRGIESQRRPRESGDPFWARTKMDSRSPAFAEDKLRGNDESGRDVQERHPPALATTRNIRPSP